MFLQCIKHPKYKGKGKRPKDCLACFALYMQLLRPRLPVKPTEVIKDKSKYNRKRKYKNNEEE